MSGAGKVAGERRGSFLAVGAGYVLAIGRARRAKLRPVKASEAGKALGLAAALATAVKAGEADSCFWWARG